MKSNRLIVTLLINLILFASCKKGWLDKKPDIALVVPTSLTDFQALLDNTNTQFAFNYGNCIQGEIGSDNYYVTPTIYSTLQPNDQNAYTWSLDVYQTGTAPDWNAPYSQIYNTNVVLEGVSKLTATPSTLSTYNNVKGSALFYRSFAYYDMAQIFSKPYDSNTSKTDLGLPLRTTANLDNDQPRASVEDTYSFIINDLKASINLLPVVPAFKTRPSKTAAYGLLARAYLSMADYNNAYAYADSCLKLYSKLVPYTSYNLTSATPIAKYGDEVIFANNCTAGVFVSTTAIIDSILYNSYVDNDLRKVVFFHKDNLGLPHLFGRYSGSSSQLFDGLAVDEIFIIRSEASARIGKISNAMDDLNTVLATRWKPGTFTALIASSKDEALPIILNERRKELCFRGLRWSDLRRLNKEPNYMITLTRSLGGKTYLLKPNENRYVAQIPALETDFNKSIVQNPK